MAAKTTTRTPSVNELCLPSIMLPRSMQPKHVEKNVKRIPVDQHGSKYSPDLAVPHFLKTVPQALVTSTPDPSRSSHQLADEQ